MAFDLLQSRNTYNEPCKWWSRLETDPNDSDELVMSRLPSGSFCAKEVNPENKQNTVIGGAFMFDKTSVTIKTPDNVIGLKNNDIVLFRSEKWIVVTTQKRLSRNQQTYFANSQNCSYYTYIELRK